MQIFLLNTNTAFKILSDQFIIQRNCMNETYVWLFCCRGLENETYSFNYKIPRGLTSMLVSEFTCDEFASNLGECSADLNIKNCSRDGAQAVGIDCSGRKLLSPIGTSRTRILGSLSEVTNTAPLVRLSSTCIHIILNIFSSIISLYNTN